MAKDPVAIVLKELKRRGWSQNELARQLGTSGAVVSRWLTRIQKPSRTMANRIEKLFPSVRTGLWN